MPTLIRLLGDSAKNTTEVRNTFKEPVLIPANAKVALTGLNAVLADDLANETFVISGNAGEFRIGIPGDGTDNDERPLATMTAGDYSAASFVDEFEIAANYTGNDSNRTTLLGLHHIADVVEGKLNLKTYLGKLGDAGFDVWQEGTYAPAAVSATGFTATATAGQVTQLLYQNGVMPLVSSQITATFVNADTVDMVIGACPFDDPDAPCFAVRVTGGTRKYQYGYSTTLYGNTTWVDLGASILAQANDVVTILRAGANVRVIIARSTGAQIYNNGSLTGITRAMSNQSSSSITWFVEASTGGQMASCQATEIEGLDPFQTLLNSNVNAVLWFVNSLSGFNSVLAMYCGFANERNKIVYRGDPATLISRTAVGGLPAYPGVLITLDGLGLLKSFDGAATAKSPANIIYSVNELQDKQQYLQLDIPEPLYLDIGNPSPINVNELRVRLFEAGGYNPLTFIGKPSFSLIIDYPK